VTTGCGGLRRAHLPGAAPIQHEDVDAAASECTFGDELGRIRILRADGDRLNGYTSCGRDLCRDGLKPLTVPRPEDQAAAMRRK
jgi:hypothetical protein